MDIRDHKHILVCGDNRNSLSILRSLHAGGVTPIVIMLKEGHIELLSKSKYIGEVRYTTDLDIVVDELLKHANTTSSSSRPFVYLTDDNHLQVIDTHYNQLKDNFYFFNAGEQGRITRYLSKQQQCILAEKCGLNVPKFEEVERGQLPITLQYPVITKTYNSYSAGWKRDVTICNTPEELLASYEHMVSERLLLQEYVVKTGELYLQGISINGGEDVYIPFEARYLNYTKTTFGWYSVYKPFHNHELFVKLRSMLKEIHFSGCFEIEFLIDEKNELHFLEINMRFSGANYGVFLGGVNMPCLWAKATLENKIDRSTIQLRKEAYYVTNDEKGLPMITQMRFRDWLRPFLQTDGFYVYNKEDKRPFYHWLWETIKKTFRHKVLRKR